MTPRLCPRCHSVLHREDEGTLVFCWNCGAPQVQLSEELRDQIGKQLEEQQAGPAADPLPTPPPTNAVIWRGAIQCAGLAGAVAAAFTLLSLALPPVVLLSLVWLVGAPIVVLGIYSARFRQTRITIGFGARLGALTGIAIAVATLTLNTAGLLLQRFVFHSAGQIDARFAELFAQMQSSMVTQSGSTAAAAPALAMLTIPEFRAGIVICSGALLLSLYLAFSATAGAFAGYLRSRAPR